MPPKSEPIALLCRHGSTKYKDDGIIMSRTDVPPDEEAEEQGAEQEKLLAKYDIQVVYSSPLVRCVIPARKFAAGRQVIQDRGLLPWDRGVLTGVLADEAKPIMDLLVANPDVRIPHGESRRMAEQRIMDFFTPALDKAEKEQAVFFTHHTVIDLLNSCMKGERDGDPGNVVEVGGVAAVFVDGDGYRMEALLNPSSSSVVSS